jgi:hypothetical protein
MRFLPPMTLLFLAGAFAQAPVGPGVPKGPIISPPRPVGPGIPGDETVERMTALSATQREFFGAVLTYSEKHTRSSLALTKSTALDMLDPTKQLPVGPGAPKAGPKPPPKPKSKLATPQDLSLRLSHADPDTRTALQDFLNSLTTKPNDNAAAIRAAAQRASGNLKVALDSVLKQDTK